MQLIERTVYGSRYLVQTVKGHLALRCFFKIFRWRGLSGASAAIPLSLLWARVFMLPSVHHLKTMTELSTSWTRHHLLLHCPIRLTPTAWFDCRTKETPQPNGVSRSDRGPFLLSSSFPQDGRFVLFCILHSATCNACRCIDPSILLSLSSSHSHFQSIPTMAVDRQRG